MAFLAEIFFCRKFLDEAKCRPASGAFQSLIAALLRFDPHFETGQAIRMKPHPVSDEQAHLLI
jgi:hypothetical protein